MKRQTLSITFKAIAGLLEYQGLDDLYRIYAICQRDGTDFNLAYISRTFAEASSLSFDARLRRILGPHLSKIPWNLWYMQARR